MSINTIMSSEKPTVTRLMLKRFRSFPLVDFPMTNPMFIVGRNGAGKSNLLDAFQFLSDAMVMPLSAVFSMRGGITNVRNRTPGRGFPPNLAISIVIRSGESNGSRYRYGFEVRGEPNYGYRVVREQCVLISPGRRFYFDRKGNELRSNVDGLSLVPEQSSLLMPLAGGLEVFAPLVRVLASVRTYGFFPEGLRELQDPDSGIELKRNASNAASVLQEIASRSPSDIERIGELLQAAIPYIKTVRSINRGKKLSLEFTQAWSDKKLQFEAYNMSDGTLRILGLLLTVFQSHHPVLLGIEEPESSLHPGAVGVLLDVLATAAKRSQLLVTTQSPEVLDSELVTDENLRVVEWTDGSSHVKKLGDVSRQALKSHLMGAGELFRMNQLVGQEQVASIPKMFLDF